MNEKTNSFIDFIGMKKDLNNHTEEIVIKTMKALLQEPEYNNICTCHQCLLDIAAYALNRLPAKYIADRKDDLGTKIAKFENEVNIDAVSVVKKAIEVVSNNPQH